MFPVFSLLYLIFSWFALIYSMILFHLWQSKALWKITLKVFSRDQENTWAVECVLCHSSQLYNKVCLLRHNKVLTLQITYNLYISVCIIFCMWAYVTWIVVCPSDRKCDCWCVCLHTCSNLTLTHKATSRLAFCLWDRQRPRHLRSTKVAFWLFCRWTWVLF